MASSSSARARSSSGQTAMGAAGPSTSSLPPVTPRRKYKRKSAAMAPLSSKQFDKMTRQLLMVQQSTRKNGETLEEESGEGTAAGDSPAIVPPADVLAALNINDAGGAGADSDSIVALGQPGKHRPAVTSTSTTTRHLENGQTVHETEEVKKSQATEHWLRRIRGTGTVGGAGGASASVKGPDGLSMARAAAKGLQGRRQAPTDSFAHEGSFIFNPLGRRVPRQSPRKAAAVNADRSRANLHHVHEETEEHRDPSLALHQDGAADDDDDAQAEPSGLAMMSRDVQEAALLEDLLYVLMGIEGQYITFAPGYNPDDTACQLRGPTYHVDDSLDASLRGLVLRILPLASCYSAVTAFVDLDSTMHYGTVTHALCAAIRNVISEYEALLVSLEHQMATSPQFTLQKLWLLIHPTLHIFSLVYGLVSDIASITHADILESDSDDEGDSDDDEDSDAEDEEMRQAQEELQRERKAIFQGDQVEGGDEDVVQGGIAKGGEVLSMLWDRVEKQSGDARAHQLFLDLFHQAAQPYARILVTWVSTGVLVDPYDEFMVFEDQKVTYDSLKTDPSDIYWEQRYTLRDQNILASRERERQGLSEEEYEARLQEDEQLIANGRGLFTGGAKIPSFLEPWKSKILLAGKYLNVVRECGIDVSTVIPRDARDDGTAERYIMTDDTFLHRIESAYHLANTSLLHLLVNDYHLIARLRSLKHYFFFSQSDFFSSFIEQAERELRKLVNPMHVRDSVKTRLQTHMGMVLGSSAVVGFTDPYKEDVKVGTALDNPYESLKRIANTRGVKGGADAAEAIALKAKMKARERDYTAILLDILEFDVTVKFPVSLVISRKNMIRWKFLHTILIQLKVTERQLSDVWLEQQAKHWQTRSTPSHPELEGWKMRVFKLRHRMTFFVQNVLAFFTGEIIEPNWGKLEERMQGARTVDQFLRDHTDFLNECRKECMLTDVRFVEFLQRLMNCARTFYDNRSRLDDHVLMTTSAWAATKAAAGGDEVKPPELGADMWRALEKQETKWARALKGFNSTVQLLATTDNPSALPLAMRLQSA